MAKKKQSSSKAAPDVITKMLVMPDGLSRVKQPQGIIECLIDEAGAEAAIEEFKQHGVDIPIDFEHDTLGEGREIGEPIPATGFITDLSYEKGIGILATVKLSDEANELIKTEAYRYVSPVATYDIESRRIKRLHSLALTNKPATEKMPDILSFAAAQRIEFDPETEGLLVASMDYAWSIDPMSKAAAIMHMGAYAIESLRSLLVELGFEVPEDMTPGELVEEAGDIIKEFVNMATKAGQTGAGTGTEVSPQASEKIVASEAFIGDLCKRLNIKPDTKADDILVAVDKLAVKTASSEELIALREEVKALKADRAAEIEKVRETRVKGKIAEWIKKGAINPNDKPAMERAERLYKASEDDADATYAELAGKPPIPHNGRWVNTAAAGPLNSREAVIASAAKEWDAAPTMNAKDVYINGELRDRNMTRLNKLELEKLGLVAA